MNVKQFTFNPFAENTYVAWDPESLEAVIIDPGMIDRAEEQRIADFIREKNLRLVHLVNTHLHVDHTFGEEFIRDNYGLKVEANAGDTAMGLRRDAQARSFGLSVSPMPLSIDVNLKDGDTVYFGNESLKVLEVPGHSPGSIVLYSPDQAVLFTGDVLFQHSIGRTDLAGGNHRQLIEGINAKLMTLPDETLVLPGHGPSTTIGEERKFNPYF